MKEPRDPIYVYIIQRRVLHGRRVLHEQSQLVELVAMLLLLTLAIACDYFLFLFIYMQQQQEEKKKKKQVISQLRYQCYLFCVWYQYNYKSLISLTSDLFGNIIMFACLLKSRPWSSGCCFLFFICLFVFSPLSCIKINKQTEFC